MKAKKIYWENIPLWYINAFANILYEEGVLQDVKLTLYFYEKPYKWELEILEKINYDTDKWFDVFGNNQPYIIFEDD